MKSLMHALVFLLMPVVCASANDDNPPHGGEEPIEIDGEWKAVFERAAAGAERLVVENIPQRPGEQQKVEFEIRGASKVAEFVKAVHVNVDGSGFHCMCDGDKLFTLYRDDKSVVSLGYHHGRSLRWHDGQWKGDALLTSESAAAIPAWFKANGYPVLQAARDAALAAQKEEERRRALFTSFFPENARSILTGPLAGRIGDHEDAERQLGEKLAESVHDNRKLTVACFKALGTVNGCWSQSIDQERRVLAALRTVDAASYRAALTDVKDDELGMHGAARTFFWEGLREHLEDGECAEWAVLLAKDTFDSAQDGNKSTVIQVLSGIRHPKVVELLTSVAEGKVGRKYDLKSRSGEEPDLRPSAVLALAQLGGKSAKELAQKMMPEMKLPCDVAALELAQALMGEPSLLKKEHFKLGSYTLGYAGLDVIQRNLSVEMIDLLLEGAMEHPWAAIRNEAIEIFEHVTQNRWRRGSTGRMPYTFIPDARKWWAAHREEVAKELLKK